MHQTLNQDSEQCQVEVRMASLRTLRYNICAVLYSNSTPQKKKVSIKNAILLNTRAIMQKKQKHMNQ